MVCNQVPLFMKLNQKAEAIALRKQGKTYSEILDQVHVAKSTLSLWLREVKLARPQKQRISQLRIDAQRRGARAVKELRVNRTSTLKKRARCDAKALVHDPRWLSGVILYWAEGSKEKPWRTGEIVSLINMDVSALKMFVEWAKKYLFVPASRFRYDLYIHTTGDQTRARMFWAEHLGINSSEIRIYLKRHNPKPFRKNYGDGYHGAMRIKITESIDLNRTIAGWIEGVIECLVK